MATKKSPTKVKEAAKKAPVKKPAAKKPVEKKPVAKKAPAKKVVAPVAAAPVVAEPQVEQKAPVEKAPDKLKQGKKQIVKDMQEHGRDTGSSEVQIAILTGKITDLVKHLKTHPKDHDSRQGLLKMVGRRRRLLRFLKKGEPAQYQALVSRLKLRK